LRNAIHECLAEGRNVLKYNILVIHPRDNVGVALRTLAGGEEAIAKGIQGFPALEEIPASHKIALCDISAGEQIIKYGETVAVSTRHIKKGEWVHTHNLQSKRWKK
jgi:altronate dehydratase